MQPLPPVVEKPLCDGDSRRSWRSLGVSIVVHSILLAVLALMIHTTVSSPSISLVMTNEIATQVEAPIGPPVEIAPPEPPPVELPVIKPRVLEPLPEIDPVNPRMGTLAANAQPTGAIAKPADEIEFFGARASGDHFVFILDNSYSMKARNKGRYRRACNELLRSVKELDERQRYSVILFSWATAPMYYASNARYRIAEGNHVAELRDWIVNATLGPGTDPRRALSLASHLNPDAVFLLTDGDFNQPQEFRADSGWVDEHGNGFSTSMEHGIEMMFVEKQIPVHTFAFENPFSKEDVQQISQLSGGTFRYVPTSDLKPIDFDRFKLILGKVDQSSRPGPDRLRFAHNLIRDGELAFAEYLIRPLVADELQSQYDRNRLTSLNQILESELGDTRLEDFPIPTDGYQ
ncbi:hypothetical protein K227x_02750 [Rubripirellula lacrimiformis]|uniref:VWFA domain-containing protein n=1 Tax=Rubripirellula lacrimiformis TaxID=1930273 RepID=A0A517N452_9BACT|nr:hypothetical protein [Rubripirellula lacrimiformis]QDT01906.1 hypothetical protein K227x_02750 [Rubripirellula lacrimiformis]